MKFVLEKAQPNGSGTLVYRPESFAFDVLPRPSNAVGSVLVNDLELEVDHGGTVLCVTGLCPHPGWQPTDFPPPLARPGVLRVSSTSDWVPGISKRLTAPYAWPMSVNRNVGYVCVGNARAHGANLECAPGCIAVVDSETLVALWLRPTQLPPEHDPSP